ncbi:MULTISPECIES: hypothetical protein [unclassified Fibrobacter]|uniref:hypothetical protein n=1 Tax=unclassified Fibrobacter TaxID=2634177 RepID=UPI000D6CE5E0|nr:MULTISPECIES: hypothetical protein [unclassified Fibrobacter]PWJ68955.1 hypothetical protein BGX12_10610 [Fibrobacter sp. UWR4]PZW63558.1 hypothetical protein C8E88_104410 [Fibrobacter sp. UWR1]
MPSFNYDDIINLPYPRNDWNTLIKHPRMSIENRAKIFAPFAALRGHSDAIEETAEKRLTIRQDELMEDSRLELDEVLGTLSERLQQGEHPVVKVSYFVQDRVLAEGVGTYEELEGTVAKLDAVTQTIQIVDKIIFLKNVKTLSLL